MKRLLIRLGYHGRRHEVARIQNELRAYAKAGMAHYWFWQGANGHELNQQWRMK